MVFSKVFALYYPKLHEVVYQFGIISAHGGFSLIGSVFASRRFSMVDLVFFIFPGLSMFHEKVYLVDFTLNLLPSVRRSFISL